ncbi:MAG: hypothetical protein KME26_04095 [Oscillatoria princeps RMCB-10]|nr:hypothetical protein [Oscillatoria princeps RMCB-10]
MSHTHPEQQPVLTGAPALSPLRTAGETLQSLIAALVELSPGSPPVVGGEETDLEPTSAHSAPVQRGYGICWQILLLPAPTPDRPIRNPSLSRRQLTGKRYRYEIPP